MFNPIAGSLWRHRCGVTAALLIALAPLSNLSAHAVITASSLETNPIKPATTATVALYFNTHIELALSKVFLISKGDIHQPVKIHNGKKPGEVLVALPPLTVGDYALKYKVFAADGHLTEDIVYFHVAE